MAKEVTMEVKEVLGVVAEHGSSSIELRLVSWNGADPKYDLRSWFVDREGNEKCAKGIALTKDDVVALRELLNILEL